MLSREIGDAGSGDAQTPAQELCKETQVALVTAGESKVHCACGELSRGAGTAKSGEAMVDLRDPWKRAEWSSLGSTKLLQMLLLPRPP